MIGVWWIANVSACATTREYGLGPYTAVGPTELFQHVRRQAIVVSQTTDFEVLEVNRAAGRIVVELRSDISPVVVDITRDGWVVIQPEPASDGAPRPGRRGYFRLFEDYVRRLAQRIESEPLRYEGPRPDDPAVEGYEPGNELTEARTLPSVGWRAAWSMGVIHHWTGTRSDVDHGLLIGSLLSGLGGYALSVVTGVLNVQEQTACVYQYGALHFAPLLGAYGGLAMNGGCEQITELASIADALSAAIQAASVAFLIGAVTFGGETNASDRIDLRAGLGGMALEGHF